MRTAGTSLEMCQQPLEHQASGTVGVPDSCLVRKAKTIGDSPHVCAFHQERDMIPYAGTTRDKSLSSRIPCAQILTVCLYNMQSLNMPTNLTTLQIHSLAHWSWRTIRSSSFNPIRRRPEAQNSTGMRGHRPRMDWHAP